MENYIVCSKDPNIVWISEKLIEDRFDANPFKAEYIEDEIKENKYYDCKLIDDILRNNKDLTGGSTPLGANYIKEGIRFIRTQDVDFNWIDIENTVFISEEDDKKLKRSSLEEGDILLTITGVNFGKSAPVRKACLPANISQHSVRMHFKECLNPYYISTFLNCLYGQKQIFKRSVGATRPAIDYSGIRTVKIPIPSIKIQDYIGDKVKKAEELREEAKRLLNDIENTVSQLFEFCYEKKRKGNFVNNKILSEDRLDADYYSVENIEAKKRILQFSNIKKLKDIAYITDGDHGKPEFKDSGVLFIRNKNVRQYLMNLDDVVYIDEAYEDKYLKSSKLEFEDILLTKIGTIGECAVYTNNEGNLNANSALIRIKDKNFVSPYYLCAILNSSIYNIILNRESGGGVQAALSLSRLGEVKVPILGTDVQIEIESMLKQYMKDKENTEKLIYESKQDIEDLIEGNFDMSKIKEIN